MSPADADLMMLLDRRSDLRPSYAEMAMEVALSVAHEVYTALIEHPDRLVRVDVSTDGSGS